MKGMLWLDDSKESLAEKVRQAVAYMKQKYGSYPSRVFTQAVHESVRVDGISVEYMPNILPHHFWLIVGDE